MKVLIAEDNAMWLTLLSESVKRLGLEPIAVSDGNAAADVIQQQVDFRMAILDWQMPGRDGIELCRLIKKDALRPFTFVILLTGKDKKEDIVQGLEAGADEYLTKPIDQAVLKSRLNSARRIIQAIPPAHWTKPQIAGYDVRRVLGKGAFAKVWQAYRELDDHPVAIKILRVDLATDKVFGRFAREIELMRELTHPNIAKIHDSRIDRQIGYYVMDLINGGDLMSYCREKALNGIDRVRMIEKVCRGLHHAHEKGVVHRDLKFANIMVTEQGEPRIVDFGMSKSMFEPDPKESEDQFQTIEGSVLGTPLFMSPEQARGQLERVDGRTDQYAAAILLYLLLVKRHPLPVVSGDRDATLKAIAKGEVRRPTEFNPKFNSKLETILLRALQRDPDDRYPTVLELADELGAFVREKATKTGEI